MMKMLTEAASPSLQYHSVEDDGRLYDWFIGVWRSFSMVYGVRLSRHVVDVLRNLFFSFGFPPKKSALSGPKRSADSRPLSIHA